MSDQEAVCRHVQDSQGARDLSAQRFKAISEAYQTLGNGGCSLKISKYDYNTGLVFALKRKPHLTIPHVEPCYTLCPCPTRLLNTAHLVHHCDRGLTEILFAWQRPNARCTTCRSAMAVVEVQAVARIQHHSTSSTRVSRTLSTVHKPLAPTGRQKASLAEVCSTFQAAFLCHPLCRIYCRDKGEEGS